MSAFVSRPLAESDDLATFECGRPEVDRWIQTTAARAHRAGVSRVTVWAEQTSGAIVALFALAPTQVVRRSAALTGAMAAGFTLIPAWRIGQLGVDVRFQNRGLGRQLLQDALLHIRQAAEIGGGRLVVIDPLTPDVARWYDSLGFRATEADGERPAPRYLLVTAINAAQHTP
jgi:GNAT superfamily N-acetyltransferase